jgi:hypothetical protein
VVEPSSCVANVQAWLEEHPDVASSPEAASALAAAEHIDASSQARISGAALQGASSMMRVYLDALERLRELSPEKPAASRLDEIRARRDRKSAA